ncbi:hypothetical protein LshimejAT787_0212610 [Lyophyllum shimeji]|uniref:DUF6593 domain-containing protein n=1 Tax=Lyophyllum shimeji TaxID=47721 RepID=A0A9P3ULT6_LYOSH|nr:hypothetical protein LshimejAT787_0212610 [Lyophyllum shimeji]
MSLLTFTFSSFNPSILNSVIVGPHSRKYFQVMTDPADPRYTIFQNVNTQVAAFIEWKQHPVVEIRGIVENQAVARWISLSPDRSCRLMEAKGRYYTWIPCGDAICLYSAVSNAPEMFAKVTRGNNTVKLEMTPQAIQAGLLEMSVVATVLLQCGRQID